VDVFGQKAGLRRCVCECERGDTVLFKAAKMFVCELVASRGKTCLFCWGVDVFCEILSEQRFFSDGDVCETCALEQSYP